MSVALISQIKQRIKKPGGSATKKAGKNKAGSKAVGKNTTLTAADLVEAKKLDVDLGGIGQARKALEFLEELGWVH